MNPPINWDDPEWGGGVHIADWAPDRHTDETDEEQP